jgi:hypothetical protein
MQAGFLTPLQGVWEGRYFIITSPLLYRSINGDIYEVPRQFKTDGASIPRLLWTCIGDPFGKHYRRPAALHDYLYSIPSFNRALADALFYESMRVEGLRIHKAAAMWAAVRLFGGMCKKG